jgi:hypothetical protein
MQMADVTNNRGESRFELQVEGGTALAAYRLSEGRIVFTHTEVPEALEGQGIGSRLVKGALDQVRGEGLKVVPACAFVRGYIDRHAEYQDLLA